MKFLIASRFSSLYKAALIGLSLQLSPAFSADNLHASLVAGSGSDANLVGINVARTNPHWVAKLGGDWYAKLHIEGSIHHLKGDGPLGNSSVVVGFTPVLRVSEEKGATYLEIGIGANYFEDKTIHRGKVMGTHFQFGDVIGAGFRFGRQQQFEVGYRFLHYSNAGISTQNPGIDLHLIRVNAVF